VPLNMLCIKMGCNKKLLKWRPECTVTQSHCGKVTQSECHSVIEHWTIQMIWSFIV
jgi:hypothetical protein